MSSGDWPLRSNANAGVFAYGCPPIDTPPFDPEVKPFGPFVPIITNPGLEALTFRVCVKCNNHVRGREPCPFCVRAELDALKRALGDAAKPVETIEALRVALRKALGALRDISRVTGGSLEPLIAECEAALDVRET